MKRFFSIVCVCAFMACLALPATAQSSGETKLYQKSIKAGTAQAYQKFLKKYPHSVYASEIAARRDTLLYISPITSAEAYDIIVGMKPELGSRPGMPHILSAMGYRTEGRDFVIGACVYKGIVPPGIVRVYCSESVKGVWQPLFTCDYEKYTLDPAADWTSILTGDISIDNVDGRTMFHLSYRNILSAQSTIEHVEALLEPFVPNAVNAIFYGKALDSQMRKIEGQSPESLVAENLRGPEVNYLLAAISANPLLVQIDPADATADESIAWWLENNSGASTTASKLAFGLLPEECSIVKAFKNDRNKEKGGGYTAALFDIRGYTVVCARNASGDYMLVWCEPKCKDRSRDKYLNTIYFEKGSTLALYYYKGRTTFKYRVNLSNKSISR